VVKSDTMSLTLGYFRVNKYQPMAGLKSDLYSSGYTSNSFSTFVSLLGFVLFPSGRLYL
jgi:hypothetical protein